MTQTQQLHLSDMFRSRRQKGRAGFPVVSVTMNGGLVHRNTLERKTTAAGFAYVVRTDTCIWRDEYGA